MPGIAHFLNALPRGDRLFDRLVSRPEPAILRGRRSLGRYQMDRFPTVEHITTEIVGDIARTDEGDMGYVMAATGKYGPVCQREEARSMSKDPLGYAMSQDKPGMGYVFYPVRDGAVNGYKAPLPGDPAVLSNHVKSLGYFLKSDLVGVCELPQWALYAKGPDRDTIVCDHKYAICVLSQWDYETFDAGRGDDWASLAESFVSYNHSAHIACTMAAYIRRLGYPARAHFQGGGYDPTYDLVCTPLLLFAGLGEYARAGWALNPYLGGRFKCAVVTTDLPLQPDKPIDFGLQEFCRVCKKCARECPSRAISDADRQVEHNGYLRYEFDEVRCTKYRVMNQNGAYCGRCVKVCPWNKPEGLVHDVVRRITQRAPWTDQALVWLDDRCGYGLEDPRYKWWFDLEDVDGDGRHVIPKRSPDNDRWTM
jgi:reductive dehalogenase